MAKGQPVQTALKVKIALEAIKEQQTISAIALKYGVQPAQVSAWKQQMLKRAEHIFADKRTVRQKPDKVSDLNKQLDRLKLEVEWLKKKTAL